MKLLTRLEVHSQKVVELGLDPSLLDLTSTEAIAGALRRIASFLCPCTAATLVRGVIRPLRGLVDDLEEIKTLAEKTLEAMIAHGDFLEHNDIEEDSRLGTTTLLYAAPPAFVVRKSGVVILLGIASDQISPLPDDYEKRIEHVNHLRRLSPAPDEDLRTHLIQLELIEIPYDLWLKAPSPETPAQHVSRLDSLLEAAQPSRDVPGLVLLDPERSVRFYPGRWVEPRSQSGRYVARRSQAYGAKLWCYIQLRDGNPERLIDLSLAGSRWRGCDEAWHLQMGIDALRAEPQRFRIRPVSGGMRVMELFSPVPMWAQRRWDAIGEPVLSTGCLFAYKLNEDEIEEELRFVRDNLWLDELEVSKKRP